MRIRCSTPGAKTWLESAALYIPNLWDNMKLHVVEFNKIPTPHKILGLFPNCHMEERVICCMLQAMNECVNVSAWSIINSKTSDMGTHVCFAINADQYAILKGCNFKLFFGAGTALFKDLSENMSVQSAQEEMNTEDNSDMEVSDDVSEVTIISNHINKTNIADESKTPSSPHTLVPMDTHNEEKMEQKINTTEKTINNTASAAHRTDEKAITLS